MALNRFEMLLNDPVLSLRRETTQDSDFLALLYRSSREDLLQLGLPRPMIDGLIDMQFRAHQAGCRNQFPGAEYDIVVKEGAPIGCLLIHADDERIRLIYIALLPHERNRGYGRRLLEARGNQKNSGFLPEERAWLTGLFDETGFVDVFRGVHPELAAYTWWSNRGQAWAKDVGWRIDYQIATPGIAARAEAASIYKEQRFSDHAPLTIDYDWS